jgi:NDP-sugar pyrophosphorylase family protein
MKAMVLCAGYGTRLGDLTRDTPKPMLDLHGRPLLYYVLKNLAKSGFSDFAINLHFQPETIRQYFGDGSALGIRITYSDEPVLLGTAGGVRKMAAYFATEPEFLVHYGDVLTDQDLAGLMRFHGQVRPAATLLLHQRAKSNSIVEMDADRRITQFWERPPEEFSRPAGPGWVNSGIYVCDASLLKLIPEGQPCDFPRDLFSHLVREQRIYGYPLTGYRCAIDSPARYLEAKAALAEGRCRIESDFPPKTRES